MIGRHVLQALPGAQRRFDLARPPADLLGDTAPEKDAPDALLDLFHLRDPAGPERVLPDHVVAEVRLDQLGDLARLEREDRGVEGRNHAAASEASEVARAADGTQVLGVVAGQLAEVRAGFGLVEDLLREALRLVVAVALLVRFVRFDLDQHVARAHLLFLREVPAVLLIVGEHLRVGDRHPGAQGPRIEASRTTRRGAQESDTTPCAP